MGMEAQGVQEQAGDTVTKTNLECVLLGEGS